MFPHRMGHEPSMLVSLCLQLYVTCWIVYDFPDQIVAASLYIFVYFLQGTIFSKTAVENYRDMGPAMFQSYIPKIPAKRLGLPEEVRSSPGRGLVITRVNTLAWAKGALDEIQ